MAGETPDEPRTGREDEFLSKSKWQRFQVLIMGPVMNILLAFVLTWVVLLRGAEIPAYLDRAPVVGAVAAGSPAERAGIKAGRPAGQRGRAAGDDVGTGRPGHRHEGAAGSARSSWCGTAGPRRCA